MRMPSASRVTKAPKAAKRFVPPFENGDRMDQKTFHELYKQTPEGFKAELIGGYVFMASPVSKNHGRPHVRLASWLEAFMDETTGVEAFDNTTNVQNDESEPQPDLTMIVEPEYGGQTTENEERHIVGAAELVIEIANSTLFVDRTLKRQNYERAGVLEYLIVMVQNEDVEWYTRGKRGFEMIVPGPDGILKSRVFPGLWLDRTGIFTRTSKVIRAALAKGLAGPEHAKFVAKLQKKFERSKKS